VNSNLKLTLSAGNVLENVRGGSGNDTLTGNSLVNRILGQSGNDSLFGGGEGDTLFGEGGDDTLHGQDGNDTLVGGTDNDAYIFVNATSAESDTVIEKINEGRDFLDFVNVTSNLNLSLSQGTSQPVHSLRTFLTVHQQLKMREAVRVTTR
jgi:Ca2+-binding RTX toxin-like protein